LNSPPPRLPFIPLIHGIVSTGISFVFTCVSTHFFALYSPFYPLPYYLPPPTGANLPSCAGPVPPSCSLILQKRKDKGSYTGSLLVGFLSLCVCVCVCVLIPNGLSPLIIYILLPLLWSVSLRFLYSFLNR
jgi:hypothetical protein